MVKSYEIHIQYGTFEYRLIENVTTYFFVKGSRGEAGPLGPPGPPGERVSANKC